MRKDSDSLNIYAYAALAASTFLSAFSMPGGRMLLLVSLLFLAADLIARRTFPKIPATAWIGFVFLAMLSVSTVISDEFVLSETKLDKLLWFVGLPVTAVLVTSPWRLAGVLGGYCAGAGVLAFKTFYDSVMWCVHYQEQVGKGLIDYKTVLINHGSITDGQRFMVALVFAAAMIFICRKRKQSSLFWWLMLALQALALVLTLKRASLMCACLLVTVFVVLKTNWKYLILLGAVFVAVAFLPPVRTRLRDIRGEFDTGKGGRVTMWCSIAPELVRENPVMGIGYRMLTNERMAEIAPHVEKDRDHLHSNIVQVLVDGGFAGLILYLVWMLSAAYDSARGVVRSRGEAELSTCLLASGLMFAALFLNGIVEYNLGDAEIVLLYGIVMGCCAAGASMTCGRKSGLSEDPVPGK